MRNIAGRIVFQPTAVPLFLYKSHVNRVSVLMNVTAAMLLALRTSGPGRNSSAIHCHLQYAAQGAADLREGQSNPFDVQRLLWLVKFQPTRGSRSLSLSLEQHKRAQHSDTMPLHTGNRNVVSLVDDPGFESQQRQKIFLFFKSRRSALRSTHIPIQLVPGSLPEAKTAGACS